MAQKVRKRFPQALACPLLCGLTILLSSCGNLLSLAVMPTMQNMQQQTDVQLVCEGAASYLLFLDSLLVSSPQDEALLRSASQSFAGYAAALEECGGERSRISEVNQKAKSYGLRLLSRHLPALNGNDNLELDRQLAALGANDVAPVFWGTFGWLSWVQGEKGSPVAIADVVKIEKIMTRLLELDEAFDDGSIHLFFALYHGVKPPALGGRPDLAKYHFERALELSNGTMLMAKTAYAATLARLDFDAELHNRLLREVMAFNLENAPERALVNRIAQLQAEKLLAEDYFGEETPAN